MKQINFKFWLSLFFAFLYSANAMASSSSCTLTQKGSKAKNISCRVLTQDEKGSIHFIDNNDNGDRYIVGAPDKNYQVGDGEYYYFKNTGKKCIANNTGLKICLKKYGKDDWKP